LRKVSEMIRGQLDSTRRGEIWAGTNGLASDVLRNLLEMAEAIEEENEREKVSSPVPQWAVDLAHSVGKKMGARAAEVVEERMKSDLEPIEGRLARNERYVDEIREKWGKENVGSWPQRIKALEDVHTKRLDMHKERIDKLASKRWADGEVEELAKAAAQIMRAKRGNEDWSRLVNALRPFREAID